MLTYLQMVILGMFILVCIIVYIFREHLVDIAEFFLGHKRLFLAVCIMALMGYFVLTYNPSAHVPHSPQTMLFNRTFG